MSPLLVPSWRVHVSTWLRFFVGNRLGPYHAMPQHVIDGLLTLADGHRPRHRTRASKGEWWMPPKAAVNSLEPVYAVCDVSK